MRKRPKVKAYTEYRCDFCNEDETIACISGMQYGSGGTVDICESCAKYLILDLKNQITNKLLGIKEDSL